MKILNPKKLYNRLSKNRSHSQLKAFVSLSFLLNFFKIITLLSLYYSSIQFTTVQILCVCIFRTYFDWAIVSGTIFVISCSHSIWKTKFLREFSSNTVRTKFHFLWLFVCLKTFNFCSNYVREQLYWPTFP